MSDCFYCSFTFESESNICPNCGYNIAVLNENNKIEVSANEYLAQVSSAINKYQKYFLLLQNTWQQKPLLFGKKEWEKNILDIAIVMYQLSCGKGIPEEFSKDVILLGVVPEEYKEIRGWLHFIRANSKHLVDEISNLFYRKTSDANEMVGYHVNEIIKYLHLFWQSVEKSKKRL